MLRSHLGADNLPTCRQSAQACFALAVGWGTLFFQSAPKSLLLVLESSGLLQKVRNLMAHKPADHDFFVGPAGKKLFQENQEKNSHLPTVTLQWILSLSETQNRWDRYEVPQNSNLLYCHIQPPLTHLCSQNLTRFHL